MAPNRPKLMNIGEAAASVDHDETEAQTAQQDAANEQAADAVEAGDQANEEVTSEGNNENGEEAISNVDLVAERKKLFSEVAGIGKDYGTGKRALVELAKAVVDKAAGGAVTSKAPKDDGKNKQKADGVKKLDDAGEIYRRFRRGADKIIGDDLVDAELVAAEGSKGSWNVQVSKLRSLIKMANKWQYEANDILADALEVHGAMLKKGEKLKESSTYSAMVSIAREHAKMQDLNHRWDKEEMERFFRAAEKTDKTAADLLEEAVAILKKVAKGKKATNASEGREGVEHEGIQNAVIEIRNVIADIDPEAYAKIVKDEEEANKTAEDGEDETEQQEEAAQ